MPSIRKSCIKRKITKSNICCLLEKLDCRMWHSTWNFECGTHLSDTSVALNSKFWVWQSGEWLKCGNWLKKFVECQTHPSSHQSHQSINHPTHPSTVSSSNWETRSSESSRLSATKRFFESSRVPLYIVLLKVLLAGARGRRQIFHSQKKTRRKAGYYS